MTVSSTVRQAGPFVGDALTTVFPFAFKCFSKTDLVVTLTVIATGAQSTLVVDSDYTVALNADQDASPGGSITYNPLGVPMPATNNLTITSNVPQSQTVTLTIGGGFFPTVISTALDRVVILIQELSLRFTRGLSVAIGDTTPGALPSKVARALKFLAFDVNGDPVASAGGASSPVSAAMAPVVAAATLAAGRTAMGVPASASGTHTGTTSISEALVLAGVISPAQITADTNDYAPANFATASMLRINTDAARNITGIAGGAAGRLMALRNVGNFTITLKDEAAASTAANRFALAGDYALATDQSVLLEYDAVSARWMLYGQQAGSTTLPPNYGYGLTLSNNAGDAVNDIDIAAGGVRDTLDAANIVVAAITKRLDANWAVGTNQGGLDTGAIANGVYHLWAIRRSDTGVTDVLFSLSATAPTMPASYDAKQRIGAILREAATIIPFTQDGNYFRRSASVLDVNSTNPGTAAVTRTLSVPTGVNVMAIVSLTAIRGTSGTAQAVLSDLAAADEAPSKTAAPLHQTSAEGSANPSDAAASGIMNIRTNTSGQIRSRVSTTAADSILRIATLGWFDKRWGVTY